MLKLLNNKAIQGKLSTGILSFFVQEQIKRLSPGP